MGSDHLFLLALVFNFVCAVSIISAVIVRRRKKRKQDFAWYKAENPSLVTNGRVQCNSCGGSTIVTERLLNGTYLRAHICRTCGTTLYYSPEQT
ncbi:hypothetical protein [uncultured Ramlibacter sp.]|uniref:hypothetical protein n=1 Tax=uncultured Ramlibacter sp. TaxID=260755 RepID=UPI00260E82D7|nr:hypothetical protein [uncultured Ramlibacter sp.]